MAFSTENSWKNAAKLTAPIFMGYLAAGIAYGILATSAGMPVWFTIMMSLTVFSGTAQYAAIPFFISGAGLISVFLSTLLISLRFIFYTLNIRQDLPQATFKRILSVAYMTDENFALLSTLSPNTRQALLLKTSLLGVFYWTLATVIGIVLGDSASHYIQHLDFALPCLFAILTYEQYKAQKQWKSIFIAFVAFLLAHQISNQYILLVAILLSIIAVAFLPHSFHHSKQDNP